MDFAKREGLLFVGGFAHPPNADAVLWFAKEVFPLIREKLDVTFYVAVSYTHLGRKGDLPCLDF